MTAEQRAFPWADDTHAAPRPRRRAEDATDVCIVCLQPPFVEPLADGPVMLDGSGRRNFGRPTCRVCIETELAHDSSYRVDRLQDLAELAEDPSSIGDLRAALAAWAKDERAALARATRAARRYLGDPTWRAAWGPTIEAEKSHA